MKCTIFLLIIAAFCAVSLARSVDLSESNESVSHEIHRFRRERMPSSNSVEDNQSPESNESIGVREKRSKSSSNSDEDDDSHEDKRRDPHDNNRKGNSHDDHKKKRI